MQNMFKVNAIGILRFRHSPVPEVKRYSSQTAFKMAGVAHGLSQDREYQKILSIFINKTVCKFDEPRRCLFVLSGIQTESLKNIFSAPMYRPTRVGPMSQSIPGL